MKQYINLDNNKQERVAIFMNSYGVKRFTNECENITYNHCKIKDYEIVAEFKHKKKVTITEIYDEVIKAYKEYDFNKIVVFDFRELCLNALKLISLTEMLKDMGIEIEIVNTAYMLDEILSNNVFLETYLYGKNGDMACYYDKEDYFSFMKELEYQQRLDLIRINQNGKVETKTIYSKDNDFDFEDSEWQEQDHSFNME